MNAHAMSSEKNTTVTMTLVLSRREFETAVAVGEETLDLLMQGGVIPHGTTQTCDPEIRRDVAVFGLQELIAGWLARAHSRSCVDQTETDGEEPF
ncbi:hypothetical protein ACX9MO_17340 [Pseudooceanicola sp. 502str34]